MTDLMPAIERSIDRGVPVLGYPSLDNLDLGIIYGYEPDAEQRKLRWLDYRSAGELLLGADKLGNLLIFLERQGLVPDPRAALIAALRSDNWRCRERAAPRPDGVYHYGAQAIATWRDDLAHVAEFDQAARQKLGFVSWFCFAALVDARSAAASFLNQAAEDFEDEIAAGLRQAAAHYGGACGAMLPAVRDRNAFLPPWGDPGLVAWTDAVRAREREILADVLSWDERAHAALDVALAAAGATVSATPRSSAPRPARG